MSKIYGNQTEERQITDENNLQMAVRLEGMRWAGRYLYGMMIAFDEVPSERVTRGEVAKTIRDCLDAINEQIADLEAGSVAPATADKTSA